MGRRKSKGPPFIQMFRWLVESPAWKILTPTERVLYLELRKRFNGRNNGSIGLGCREAAEAINVGRDTANRAFQRLVELGFIEPTEMGAFRTNGRKATEWLLTELPDDRTGHRPLKKFMSWKAETAAARKKASPISSHVSPISRTRIAARIDNETLRPILRTQTGEMLNSASDTKDTYRSTTPSPFAEPVQLAEEAPNQKGRAHRSEQAEGSFNEPFTRSNQTIHVSDALRATLRGKEVANG